MLQTTANLLFFSCCWLPLFPRAVTIYLLIKKDTHMACLEGGLRFPPKIEPYHQLGSDPSHPHLAAAWPGPSAPHPTAAADPPNGDATEPVLPHFPIIASYTDILADGFSFNPQAMASVFPGI